MCQALHPMPAGKSTVDAECCQHLLTLSHRRFDVFVSLTELTGKRICLLDGAFQLRHVHLMQITPRKIVECFQQF